jgi:hypothetical protein
MLVAVALTVGAAVALVRGASRFDVAALLVVAAAVLVFTVVKARRRRPDRDPTSTLVFPPESKLGSRHVRRS